MKYGKLGSSDLLVSNVCLGTMTWGSQNTEGAYVHNHQRRALLTSVYAEEAHEQLDAFIALGGNFIDTAELYPVPPDAKYGGATEEIIGNYLSKHPGVREKLVIATKVSGPTTSNWIPANREKALTGSWDDTALLPRLKPEQIKRACQASLKRMKTDYIDLYQLHWPDRYTPLWGSFVYVFLATDKWALPTRADSFPVRPQKPGI